MVTFISHSPAETLALGEQWGREATAGWIVGLSGPLGAGKTQLVKGLARGLGIEALVRSPTFALMNEYKDGRLPLTHVDLYRLETPEQIVTAGLDEYWRRPAGVVVVEWAERWPEFASPRAARATHPVFRLAWFDQLSENERRITYEDSRA
jgi:tRNA threonylcarbamoyladenosine biosynthesis protein TsaE